MLRRECLDDILESEDLDTNSGYLNMTPFSCFRRGHSMIYINHTFEKKKDMKNYSCQTSISIVGVFPHWQENITDNKVTERAGPPNVITSMRRKAQIRWAGHVSRMANSRIPTELFYGVLQHGRSKIGGQRKRYKYSQKSTSKTSTSILLRGKMPHLTDQPGAV